MKKYLSAEQALQKVALQNNTTVEQVRKEISLAIQIGMHNSDPKVQARWKKIPRVGDVPTPEEFLIYAVKSACGNRENKKK